MKLAPALALALFALAGHAQTADPLQARSWAAACANCHSVKDHAKGNAQAGIHSLTGMQAQSIIDKVQAFRSGRTPSTVMQQLAKGYSDAEIAAIAKWFEAQAK